MVVVVPCNATEEYKTTIAATVVYKETVYLRFCRIFTSMVTEFNDPFKIGKGCVLPYVSDVSTIAMRIMVPAAFEAAKKLSQHNDGNGIIDVYGFGIRKARGGHG